MGWLAALHHILRVRRRVVLFIINSKGGIPIHVRARIVILEDRLGDIGIVATIHTNKNGMRFNRIKSRADSDRLPCSV